MFLTAIIRLFVFASVYIAIFLISHSLYCNVTMQTQTTLVKFINLNRYHCYSKYGQMYPYREFYCFILYAFNLTSQNLLTSSCIVHSRKFRSSQPYILTFALLCNFVSFCISQIKTCIIISIGTIPTFANIFSVRKF